MSVERLEASTRLLDGLSTSRGLAAVPLLGPRMATVAACCEDFAWHFDEIDDGLGVAQRNERFEPLRQALSAAQHRVQGGHSVGKKRCGSMLLWNGAAEDAQTRVRFPRPAHGNRVREMRARITTLGDKQCVPDGLPMGSVLLEAGALGNPMTPEATAVIGAAVFARNVLAAAALYQSYSARGKGTMETHLHVPQVRSARTLVGNSYFEDIVVNQLRAKSATLPATSALQLARAATLIAGADNSLHETWRLLASAAATVGQGVAEEAGQGESAHDAMRGRELARSGGEAEADELPPTVVVRPMSVAAAIARTRRGPSSLLD